MQYLKTTDLMGLFLGNHDLNEEQKGLTVSGSVTIVKDCTKEMRKTGNPFVKDGVLKVETINGMFGNYSYTKAVAKVAGVQEEEVNADSLPWGSWMPNKMFIQHMPKGETEMKYYIRCKLQSAKTYAFINKATGDLIPEDEIKPFLPVKTDVSSTQSELGITADDAVKPLTICFNNVIMAKVFGEDIVISQ